MNVVALVGRPNVGKSSLFNRIVGQRDAIVEATPGVTRDRIYGSSDWNGYNFIVIDTGGFIPGSEDTMERSIREQAMLAVDEADVIMFVCDAKDGVTPFDSDIAKILRSSHKPVVLIINKCDNELQDANSYEFHSLGVGEPFPTSALSGRNSGEFMDAMVAHFQLSEEEVSDPRLKIAFIGRPNVGKSSIANALLGKERSIVTDIPGTTRDAVDSIVKFYGEEIVLIDTAGLRKKAQVKENIEMYSVLRTAKAIQRCDVAVLILDAQQGLEEQDKRILVQIDEFKKGILMVVNKWDLLEKDDQTSDLYTKRIYEEMKTFDYLPVLFTSAITKQRITKIIEYCKDIHARRQARISTSRLNKYLLEVFEKTPPPAIEGKDLRINYVTQVRSEPPVFALFCNFPLLIPDNYKRFIERTIRKKFDLAGVPISLVFKKKNVSWIEKEN